jgi:hypothetical protein
LSRRNNHGISREDNARITGKMAKLAEYMTKLYILIERFEGLKVCSYKLGLNQAAAQMDRLKKILNSSDKKRDNRRVDCYVSGPPLSGGSPGSKR